MRCPPARSLALMALALSVITGAPPSSLLGQEAEPPRPSDPAPKLEERIADLDGTIRQQIDAGRIAEAIPPAREKLDLLVRLRGKDHWQAGDARRDVETYERLAERPREVRDRFAEARREGARGSQLFAQAQYARALEPLQKALAIDREILGEGHPTTANSYNNVASTLQGQGKFAEGEAMHRRALAIRLKALPEGHPDVASSYDNLAATSWVHGKQEEAEAMKRRALAIRLKALPEGHLDIANSYNNLASTLSDQGKYAEAEAMYRLALAILLKSLPEGHLHIAISYDNLAGTLSAQAKYAEAEAMHRHALAILLKSLPEEHADIAISYTSLALTLSAQGKYAEAEAMGRRALAIRLKVLPEGHPHIAQSYSNLGKTLSDEGKSAEAEAMGRRALALVLKALPEGHPQIAGSYNNLAGTLSDQGKYAEAEAMYRRALAIRLKALPEGHPDIAQSDTNIAGTLLLRGRYAEAEAMQRRALAIVLKALPEGHPLIAQNYGNLSMTLAQQGKHSEAEAMQRSALAILLKALPEGHPDIARTYGGLATTLAEQGKHGEAEAMHRHSLAILLKALPEGHPDIATSYHSLALVLSEHRNYEEAEAMLRRALAINLKALPEGHPYIATSYGALAMALSAQGRHAEAEEIQRNALAILLKALSEGHPRIANSYGHLAYFLDRQGKHDEALRAWRSAAATYEQARLSGPRGLDAALGEDSPLPHLAAALAGAGRPRDAWESWERGLARGITDEVTRRAVRPLTAEERDREAGLLGRGQALDERINRLLAARALTSEQEKALDGLRQQAGEIRRELLELERQFEDRYDALASRPASLEEARKAIADGTALLGWVDTQSDHWACLLGRSGDPVWVRLAGSGKDGDWTRDEKNLSRRLRAQLDPETTEGKAGPLAEALTRHRLEPLKPHLTGIKRLIVVNSPGMAGVPVEVLMAARPDPAWDTITVSYAPSAAMLAYLAGRPVPRDRPATLLAVADPAYPEPKADAPAPEPPASGIAVARVAPNGNADLNGIREGDVLLTYAGTELKQAGDLKPVASDGGPKKVPVKYWREGITREAQLAAGRLGVAIDPRPASAFVRARRESERLLLGMRGGTHARLPGTRREVEALAGLFPDGGAMTILGPRACEATVQGLARSGQLKGFRYLHFATHGQSDPRFAYRTALILAPDPDSSADPSALETDGTITAEQIARTWELDADLVVLSAGESGLGRADAGEGYLGFAQPLFARGARSLVLSQWKVDDDATALLMARFYRNLLGKREGLTAPMPKAEALAEAKRWLRTAGPSNVRAALAALPRGEIVRRQAVKAASSAHPYEDPTYWAGFVLVGAPD